jgi:Tfp pilus assembly protein PilV
MASDCGVQHPTLPSPSTESRCRRGATLVELLVALLLFDMSLLSLVAVSAVAVRRVGEAGRRNRAVIAAASRLEWLASGQCVSATSGSATLEAGVTERWTSTPIAGGQELLDSVRIEARAPEYLVLRARRLC